MLPNPQRGMDAAGRQRDRLKRDALRLDGTGTTPRSTRAIENVRRICEEDLNGGYDLEVDRHYQQPTFAKASRSLQRRR